MPLVFQLDYLAQPAWHLLIGLGKEFDFTPGRCATAQRQQVFILGDSHAGAYFRLAYRLASEAKYKTHIITLGGCPFIKRGFDNTTRRGCPEFQRQAADAILAHANPGDTLILAALQAPRFRDYWDEPIGSAALDEFNVHPADKAEAVIAAMRLAPFAKAGMFTFIEMPKPTMVSAAFRCSDWFNRSNSYCVADVPTTRALQLNRSARARAYFVDVAAKVPNSRLWNIFNTLCSGPVCRGWANGHPIYTDTDHLSGYGNDLAYLNLVKQLTPYPQTRIRHSSG